MEDNRKDENRVSGVLYDIENYLCDTAWMDEENKMVAESISNLMQANRVLHGKIADQLKKICDLQMTNLILTTTNQKQENDLQRYTTEIKYLNVENTRLLEENAKFSQKLETHQIKNIEEKLVTVKLLQEENSKLHQQLDNFKNVKVVKYANQLQFLTEQINTLQIENRKLQTINENRKQAIINLDKENESLHNVIDQQINKIVNDIGGLKNSCVNLASVVTGEPLNSDEDLRSINEKLLEKKASEDSQLESIRKQLEEIRQLYVNEKKKNENLEEKLLDNFKEFANKDIQTDQENLLTEMNDSNQVLMTSMQSKEIIFDKNSQSGNHEGDEIGADFTWNVLNDSMKSNEILIDERYQFTDDVEIINEKQDYELIVEKSSSEHLKKLANKITYLEEQLMEINQLYIKEKQRNETIMKEFNLDNSREVFHSMIEIQKELSDTKLLYMKEQELVQSLQVKIENIFDEKLRLEDQISQMMHWIQETSNISVNKVNIEEKSFQNDNETQIFGDTTIDYFSNKYDEVLGNTDSHKTLKDELELHLRRKNYDNESGKGSSTIIPSFQDSNSNFHQTETIGVQTDNLICIITENSNKINSHDKSKFNLTNFIRNKFKFTMNSVHLNLNSKYLIETDQFLIECVDLSLNGYKKQIIDEIKKINKPNNKQMKLNCVRSKMESSENIFLNNSSIEQVYTELLVDDTSIDERKRKYLKLFLKNQ